MRADCFWLMIEQCLFEGEGMVFHFGLADESKKKLWFLVDPHQKGDKDFLVKKESPKA